jgi:hypothetical protein
VLDGRVVVVGTLFPVRLVLGSVSKSVEIQKRLVYTIMAKVSVAVRLRFKTAGYRSSNALKAFREPLQPICLL